MKAMHSETRSGFTIVELIIVVIVIAILAAVVVVAYNGITRSATEASMRSDLQNVASELERTNQRNKGYPTDPSAVTMTPSGANNLTYESKPYGYCIAATNTKTNAVYNIKSTNPEVINDGGCVVASNATWSGSASYGNNDGPAGTAQFSNNVISGIGPVVVNSQGVTFLANTSGNRIRMIALDGTVTTFAGDGTGSYQAGVGTAAKVCSPNSIAIDANDNLYVRAGCATDKILKITPQAVVTIITVNPDGNNAIAGVDPASNIWMTQTTCAKKYSQNGTLLLTVGNCSVSAAGYQDGPAASALFGFNSNGSVGIGGAVDRLGNLFVADRANNKVRKVTPDGTVSTFFGQGTITAAGSGGIPIDGPAATIGLTNIRQIAVDGTGAVWLTTKENYMFLRRIDPNGSAVKTTSIGTGGVKNGNQPGYLSVPEPGYITIDNKRGFVYISGSNTYINQVAL